jgi:hypothetical protein
MKVLFLAILVMVSSKVWSCPNFAYLDSESYDSEIKTVYNNSHTQALIDLEKTICNAFLGVWETDFKFDCDEHCWQFDTETMECGGKVQRIADQACALTLFNSIYDFQNPGSFIDMYQVEGLKTRSCGCELKPKEQNP